MTTATTLGVVQHVTDTTSIAGHFDELPNRHASGVLVVGDLAGSGTTLAFDSPGALERLLADGVEIAFCGRNAQPVRLPAFDGPPPTNAGVRATLLTAAGVLERCGWTQGQARSLTGALCIGAALAVAADGDEDAELHATVALAELVPWPSLVEWNDEPERTRDDVVGLLRFAAVAVCAA